MCDFEHDGIRVSEINYSEEEKLERKRLRDIKHEKFCAKMDLEWNKYGEEEELAYRRLYDLEDELTKLNDGDPLPRNTGSGYTRDSYKLFTDSKWLWYITTNYSDG